MNDYKVFYRKYRPKNFNELIGQDNIKDVLMNSIKSNKIAHSYIFTGPRGTGKTSTAKIFAKTLNCTNNKNGNSCDECENCLNYNNSADIIEIDAASNNGVEEIRSLRDSVKIAPYNSKYKIYIIDEVHMLSNSAWNAFLKTLEEPPGHVIFILATTEINKIPDTVKSRCQRFDFSKIPMEVMYKYLSDISKKENISIDEEAIKSISNLSNGCLRDALSYLDKISKLNCDINEEIVENNFGILSKTKLKKLYDNIVNHKIEKISENLDNISNSGVTPLNFINDFINYLIDEIISKNIREYNEIYKTKELINKLNNLIINFNSAINPYLLIKIELITSNYFPGNNEDLVNNKESCIIEDLSLKKEKTIDKNSGDKISINDISENNSFEKSYVTTNIKNIRINNCFFKASKELKKDFLDKWNNLLNKLNIKNEYNILGMIEKADIQVVSDTNVLFSLKKDNESLIFNNNINVIEKYYNDEYHSNYKFISLSSTEWNKERKKFIENKDKKYEYINENDNLSDESTASNIAENLFDDNILEIR